MASDEILQARCVELVTSWTAWDRRAWQPGTVLALRELAEATLWSSQRVLSDEAVTWLQRTLRAEIGKDAGLRSPAVRSQLDAILKEPLKYSSQRRRELETLVDWIDSHYLDAWSAAVAGDYEIERASRYMTSYLVDSGHHPEFLRKHIEQLPAPSAAELVEDLRALSSSPRGDFNGWVILSHVPEPQLMQNRPSWMSPAEVSAAMNGIGEKPPRGQSGALRFQVQARDQYAAAAFVRDEMERLANRTKFLRTSKRLQYLNTWWLESGEKILLSARQTSVNAMSLAKSGILYTLDQDAMQLQQIDDAFELASHLITSPPAVAVSSAWAALESLLIDPRETDREAQGRVIAADRGAAIITAGWPRAELTRLSHRVSGKGVTCPTSIRRKLDEAGDDNLARCKALLGNWQAVASVSGLSATDAAALNRVQRLIDNPKATLQRVEGYMRSSLRRLYRQRNLIMHGGAVRSVALPSTARNAGPLVGALLDRIVVAAHLESRSPLDAVAVASVSLQQCRKAEDLMPLFDHSAT